MNRNIKFGGIAASIIIIAFCGYNMSILKLWSWWTMPFLLAIWALVVFLFEKRYNQRWLLLSTLSGILFSVGFPISPLTPILFVGFVPLLMVEKEISEKNAQNTVEERNPDSFGKGGHCKIWRNLVGRIKEKPTVVVDDFRIF